MLHVDEEKDDSDEDKTGLDKTILFVIIGVVVVFILVISVAIYFRIKRRRTHRKARLNKGKLDMGDPNAEAIAFQPNDVELNGRDGDDDSQNEEIDLEVLDSEAVRLHRKKEEKAKEKS